MEKNEKSKEINISINKVNKRILKLSPTVRYGLERECTKEDFLTDASGKPIGSGAFGQVFKVFSKESGKEYAIKVMKKDLIKKDMEQQINREISIMYQINHPHIIKLINNFEDDKYLYLVMELGSKGNLFSLLKTAHHLDQQKTAQYMREIISALKYLHSYEKPIIHRDIKPENILLDENGRCKLADFGWSNYVSDENQSERKTFCGTEPYLAPEMIAMEGHSTSLDIWALGVLMFELLSGTVPFPGNDDNLYRNIKNIKIAWPGDFNPLAKNLIMKILKRKPEERLTLDEILNHTWFTNNQQMYPLLEEKNITELEYFEQHMISVKTQDLKEKLKKLMENDKIRNEITNEIKKMNHSYIVNQKKNSSASVSPLGSPIANANLNNSINYNNNNVTKDQKEIKEQKEAPKEQKDASKEQKQKSEFNPGNEIEVENNCFVDVKKLQIMIDDQKKMILDMKKKNDRFVLENGNLKKDLDKYKNSNSSSSDKKRIEQLEEELDRYKVRDNDRLKLLSEVEDKTNQIILLTTKNKEYKDDKELQEKNISKLEIKAKEDQEKIKNLNNRVEELNKKIEEHLKDKEDAIAKEKDKYDRLFNECFKNEEDGNSEDSQNKQNRLLEFIIGSISDYKKIFSDKFEALNKSLNEIKENTKNSDDKFSVVIEDTSRNLKEIINTTKKSIEECINSKISSEKESGSKIKERLDWQNEQIKELMEYKFKSANFETKLTNYDSRFKVLENNLKVKLEELNVMKKELDYKIKEINKLKNDNLLLESDIANLKNFILRQDKEVVDNYYECKNSFKKYI